MTTNFLRRNPRILVLNPNSSHDMTHGMETAIKGMQLSDSLEIYTYTAPKNSPPSINDGKDLEDSTDVVLTDLASSIETRGYDGIIVACYSVHPLVKKLSHIFEGRVFVTGIFESSILTALSLISPYPSKDSKSQAWGIVTTGKFWEDHLSEGIKTYLGQETSSSNSKFAGVYSTGLNAGDFHDGVSPDVIRDKLKEAAKKLLESAAIGCVVMGCAGMAGLEEIIRASAIEQYGEACGRQVCIVDGVKAGIMLLDQTTKSKRMFQKG